MKIITGLALAALAAILLAACTDAQAREVQQIEQQYGVSGAYTGSVATDDGAAKGTLVPITLSNGRQALLFIPQKKNNDAHAVYIRDEQGLHPVQLREKAIRADVVSAPAVVETKPEPAHKNKRSWEKEALIIGGAAGAGTAIGAMTGGKKGAGIGATAGGVGGLIYDLLTRDKK